MKKQMKSFFAIPMTIAAAFALTACDVDKTSDGELPEIDVDAEAGKLPSYEVNTPEVETGTKTVEVEVPTVDVKPAEDGDDN